MGGYATVGVLLLAGWAALNPVITLPRTPVSPGDPPYHFSEITASRGDRAALRLLEAHDPAWAKIRAAKLSAG